MRRNMTRALRVLALCAAGLSFQGLATAQTRELDTKGVLLDRIAAIVNDGVVLTSELDTQIQAVSQRLETQHLELPPENVLRQQVLDRLVLQEIQLQRATHVGIKVTDETLNAAMEDVAKRNNLSLSQLPDALATQGIDYASYRDDLRKEITLSMLRQRDVLEHISVTSKEIDQYLEKQAKMPSAQNEYNVSHILIAVGQEATQAQIDQAAGAPPTCTSGRAAARTSPARRRLLQQPDRARGRLRSAGARAASCRRSSPTSSRPSSRDR